MLSEVILISWSARMAGLCNPKYCFAMSMFIAPCMFQLVIFAVPDSFFPGMVSVVVGSINLMEVSYICLNRGAPARVLVLCRLISVRW